MTKTAIAKITAGNSKLGSGIFTWSLPAGLTCPGETEACSKVCYAKKGFFVFASHDRLYKENYRISKTPTFARWMVSQVKAMNANIVRIHVSGDFYNTDYVYKWIQIVKACPTTTFYAYTRSWQTHTKVEYEALEMLAELPNMRLWWSADRDTGKPIQSRNARVAYMMLEDGDLPNFGADLLFRVDPKTVMKKILGTQVCPVENGQEVPTALTCGQCRICFMPKVHQLVPALKKHVLPSESVRLAFQQEVAPTSQHLAWAASTTRQRP